MTLLTFRALLKATLTLDFLLAQRFWGVAKGRYINFLSNMWLSALVVEVLADS